MATEPRAQLKVGDVVSLKSADFRVPRMTVERGGESRVSCVWLDNTGNCRRDDFLVETLFGPIAVDLPLGGAPC